MLVKQKINTLFTLYRRYKPRCYPSFLLPDLKDVIIDRPIFLLGTQGGGLTLISRIIRRNSDVVSVTGDSDYWCGPDEMQNVLANELPETLKLYGHRKLKVYGKRGGWMYASELLLNYFRKDRKDVNEEEIKIFRSLLKKVIALYGNSSTTRFIDKSQSYTIKVSYIQHALKDTNPYFLLITRNPYVMCYRATYKSHLARQNFSYKKTLELAAQHWTNSMHYAINDGKNIENFKIVKYEDFLENPYEKVNEISKFLELSFDEFMLPGPDDKIPLGGVSKEKWYPIREDVNEKYLKEIGKETIQKVNEIGGKVIEKLGYEKI